jgi:SNF2 family DNA or RNA helicase
MVVVDEATKLKSLRASVKKHPKTGTEFVSGQGGQRALALLKVVYQHKPSRFVELSGTPAPNGLQDLWGQVYFLDYGQRLGNTYNAFRNRWFIQSFDGFSIEPTTNAQVEIQEKVKDICLSLKSEDWFDLAKPIERNIYVELPPDARKQYRDMERKLLADISGEKIEAFNAGARTMKCLQMAAGACYTGNTTDPGERKWVEAHKAKLDALDEIVEEAGGQPILVAYNFKADLARLLKRFPQGKQLDQNSATIKAWNAGKIPLLFTHPASAGHGLNLQMGSNILVYFSLDWNFENHAQIAERIGPVRQAQAGLNRNVYIYKIIARNTIDEDVLKVLETKRTIQDVLMESLKRRAA